MSTCQYLLQFAKNTWNRRLILQVDSNYTYTYCHQTRRSTSSYISYLVRPFRGESQVVFPAVWYGAKNQPTLRDHNPSAQLRCPVSYCLPHVCDARLSPRLSCERVAAAWTTFAIRLVWSSLTRRTAVLRTGSINARNQVKLSEKRIASLDTVYVCE